MVEAALLELTGSCDTARMRYGTDRFLNDFYKGDGMYGDGKFFHMDYYNSYVIHPMLLDVLTVMERHGLSDSCTLATERRRHTRYAAILERMVAPDGSYPVLGRSITACRFGVFHALGQSALLHALPKEVAPAQVRCAMTAFCGGSSNVRTISIVKGGCVWASSAAGRAVWPNATSTREACTTA